MKKSMFAIILASGLLASSASQAFDSEGLSSTEQMVLHRIESKIASLEKNVSKGKHGLSQEMLLMNIQHLEDSVQNSISKCETRIAELKTTLAETQGEDWEIEILEKRIHLKEKKLKKYEEFLTYLNLLRQKV